MIDWRALVPAVREHAARHAPRECCGLAVIVRGRLRYFPCRNVAAEGFAIHPDDQAAAEDAGEVVAVCHSHVFLPPEPSEADRVMCEQTVLPWLIVTHPTGEHLLLEPSGYRAPLVGRPFVHGVLDCYSLCRDYYRETLGLGLPDYPRQDEWWLKGGNLYLEHFAEAGFVEIDPESLRAHDALLMQVASPVPNHAAIYLGDGLILHHCHGRLSSRDVYGGYWRKVTVKALRHRSLA